MANRLILANSDYESIDTTSAPDSISLTATIGKQYLIKNIGTGGNALTVNYGANVRLLSDDQMQLFVFDGTSWGDLATTSVNGGTVTNITALTVANNVDIGNFELRARTFESDVVTGTAPLTVASTTKVTNLNADLLDGISSASFVRDTGNETIGGIKTFSSIPILPASSPTTDNQAVRKKYVDDLTTGSSYSVYTITTGTNQVHALPTAVGAVEQVIKRHGTGTGKVTFTTVSGQTIEGLTASTWELEGEGIIIVFSSGGNWEVKEYSDSGTTPDSGIDSSRIWKKDKDGALTQQGVATFASLALATSSLGSFRNSGGSALFNYGLPFIALPPHRQYTPQNIAGISVGRNTTGDSATIGSLYFWAGSTQGTASRTVLYTVVGRWRT